MALMRRGKLFAGALFAGVLFGPAFDGASQAFGQFYSCDEVVVRDEQLVIVVVEQLMRAHALEESQAVFVLETLARAENTISDTGVFIKEVLDSALVKEVSSDAKVSCA